MCSRKPSENRAVGPRSSEPRRGTKADATPSEPESSVQTGTDREQCRRSKPESGCGTASGTTAPLRSDPEDRGLVCSGIWGGIRDLDREVTAGGLIASIHASSCDGGKGGDIYYIGVCVGDTITRVAIADVVGHGEAVSEVGQYMYGSLEAHMCDPDSAVILSEVHELASRRGLSAMTTAAIAAYDATRRQFQVSYAGHPPLLHKRADGETWSIVTCQEPSDGGDDCSLDLPLAVVAHAAYRQLVLPVRPGDRLFVYTDGVTETPNAEGTLFGIDRLNEVLHAHADASLSDLKSAVLAALHRHAGGRLTHDDVTLIAIEVR